MKWADFVKGNGFKTHVIPYFHNQLTIYTIKELAKPLQSLFTWNVATIIPPAAVTNVMLTKWPHLLAWINFIPKMDE